MSKVYLHSKNKYYSLVIVIIGLLIPFLIYGFYKNGFLLYKKGLVQFIGMFKPFVLVSLGVLASFVVTKLKKKPFLGNELLSNVMFAMIVTPSTKLWLFAVVLLVLNIILYFKDFNIAPAGMLIILFVLIFMKRYSFLNIYESLVDHRYSFIDYLMGKGPGGISNTFLIMSIISLIILSCNINYKRAIPLFGLCAYYLLIMITCFVKGDFSYTLALNNNVVFAFIFILPLSTYSPYIRGSMYIYGIISGILTYILSFIDVNYGVYLAIFSMSIIASTIDNLMTYNPKYRKSK